MIAFKICINTLFSKLFLSIKGSTMFLTLPSPFYTLIVELDSLSGPFSLLFEKAGHEVVLGQGSSTGCSGDEHEKGGWDWQPRENAQKSLCYTNLGEACDMYCIKGHWRSHLRPCLLGARPQGRQHSSRPLCFSPLMNYLCPVTTDEFL